MLTQFVYVENKNRDVISLNNKRYIHGNYGGTYIHHSRIGNLHVFQDIAVPRPLCKYLIFQFLSIHEYVVQLNILNVNKNKLVDGCLHTCITTIIGKCNLQEIFFSVKLKHLEIYCSHLVFWFDMTIRWSFMFNFIVFAICRFYWFFFLNLQRQST